MSSATNQTGSRRDFLRSAARSGGLVALAAVLAWLQRPRRQQNCINNNVCAGCAAFTDCGLPTALSAKAAQATNFKEAARE